MKLSKELNFICFVLLFYFVNCQQQQTHQQRHHARKIQQKARTRRIYAMCPPTFTKIGSECYYLSSTRASWLDSHFECKDKNSKLAEPLKYSDRLLRKYLAQRGRARGDIWIGGMYNWQRNKWQWGYNGKDMTYQSFSQMKPGEDLKYHCAILNPDLKYRWSAKLCFEKHFYLCQHRMPYVSEKNRQRIYAKWNETYPGQLANEIQVDVMPNEREIQQRSGGTKRKSQQKPQDQSSKVNNRSQAMTTRQLNNEIDPPEVLSAQDAQHRRKKQQSNKSKENRTLILTGNVDLGKDVFKKSKQFRRKKINLKSSTSTPATTTTSTQHPNIISENYQSNHHRHNHYRNNDNDESHRRMTQQEAPQYPVTYRQNAETSTVSNVYIQPTVTTTDSRSAPHTNQQRSSNTTLSLNASRQIEKKKRLENIREKLSRLSDEEKIEYLKLKAQRKAQRSKSINDTTS